MTASQPHRERLVLLSTIAAQRAGDGWNTLDLWARDLETQAQFIDITLLCPESDHITGALAPNGAPAIQVITFPPPLPDARLRLILSPAPIISKFREILAGGTWRWDDGCSGSPPRGTRNRLAARHIEQPCEMGGPERPRPRRSPDDQGPRALCRNHLQRNDIWQGTYPAYSWSATGSPR